MTVYLPQGMRWGIASGDWNRLRGIIYSLFGESSVDVFIVEKKVSY